MQVERIISQYNDIRSSHRFSMGLDIVSDRLCILLNICMFAQHTLIRDRVWPNFCQHLDVEGEPDPDIYEKRFYAAKFFLEITTICRLLLTVLVH